MSDTSVDAHEKAGLTATVTLVAQKPRFNAKTVVAAVAALVIIVVLALGLGLGLGLKHDKKTGSTGSSTMGGSSEASMTIQPWRKSVEGYNLDLGGWDFNAPPTTRRYNFTLSEITAAPDGVNRTILAVNGQSPGPLIRINQGDRLIVNVTNNLTNATAMHWHGMYQDGTPWYDGSAGITQCPIAPGQSLVYNFTVANQNGTYWYHSHAGTQYIDGLVGPLIVHSPQEADIQNESYDFDQIILLTDYYHDLSAGLLPQYLASGNENVEPVPDNGLINGANYFNCSSYSNSSGYSCSQDSARPVFSVESGKKYRLRFINTGAFTTFEVSVDNHTLEVIEADGTATQPLPVHRFEIATAQRYSVILNANQSSGTNYWLRSVMNENCYASTNDVLDPHVQALITYKNNTDAPTNSVDWSDAYDVTCRDLNNTALVPLNAMQAPPADVLFDLQFSFGIGNDARDVAKVNGTTFVPPLSNPTLQQAVAGLQANNASFSASGVSTAFSENQLVMTVPDNQVVDVLVLNFDDGAHPFHFHGHSFWVIATSNEQYFDWENSSLYAMMNSTSANVYTTNPMRRDTISINAFSWALLRFRSDNPGLWIFHCHNIWHLEAGLAWQFMARTDLLKTLTIPKSVTNLCKA